MSQNRRRSNLSRFNISYTDLLQEDMLENESSSDSDYDDILDWMKENRTTYLNIVNTIVEHELEDDSFLTEVSQENDGLESINSHEDPDAKTKHENRFIKKGKWNKRNEVLDEINKTVKQIISNTNESQYANDLNINADSKSTEVDRVKETHKTTKFTNYMSENDKNFYFYKGKGMGRGVTFAITEARKKSKMEERARNLELLDIIMQQEVEDNNSFTSDESQENDGLEWTNLHEDPVAKSLNEILDEMDKTSEKIISNTNKNQYTNNMNINADSLKICRIEIEYMKSVENTLREIIEEQRNSKQSTSSNAIVKNKPTLTINKENELELSDAVKGNTSAKEKPLKKVSEKTSRSRSNACSLRQNQIDESNTKAKMGSSTTSSRTNIFNKRNLRKLSRSQRAVKDNDSEKGILNIKKTSRSRSKSSAPSVDENQIDDSDTKSKRTKTSTRLRETESFRQSRMLTRSRNTVKYSNSEEASLNVRRSKSRGSSVRSCNKDCNEYLEPFRNSDEHVFILPSIPVTPQITIDKKEAGLRRSTRVRRTPAHFCLGAFIFNNKRDFASFASIEYSADINKTDSSSKVLNCFPPKTRKTQNNDDVSNKNASPSHTNKTCHSTGYFSLDCGSSRMSAKSPEQSPFADPNNTEDHHSHLPPIVEKNEGFRQVGLKRKSAHLSEDENKPTKKKSVTSRHISNYSLRGRSENCSDKNKH